MDFNNNIASALSEMEKQKSLLLPDVQTYNGG